jgi:hypothetical protein
MRFLTLSSRASHFCRHAVTAPMLLAAEHPERRRDPVDDRPRISTTVGMGDHYGCALRLSTDATDAGASRATRAARHHFPRHSRRRRSAVQSRRADALPSNARRRGSTASARVRQVARAVARGWLRTCVQADERNDVAGAVLAVRKSSRALIGTSTARIDSRDARRAPRKPVRAAGLAAPSLRPEAFVDEVLEAGRFSVSHGP